MSGADAVKEALFAFFESRRERFVDMAARGTYGSIAEEAVSARLEDSTHMMPRNAALQTLAIGAIHYTLTISATPSQRKVLVDGVPLDVVVPGTRELRRDPGSALVVLVSCDCAEAERRLHETYGIQPIHQNAWLLTQDCTPPGARRFTISGEGATLSDMVDGMVRFARSRGYHRRGMVV